MFVSKKVALTLMGIAAISASLFVATVYGSRFEQSAAPALGIEIALAKPFYVPAATDTKGMSAVVRAPINGEYSGREITAVKLVPVMEKDKVKVTVYALIGDQNDIKEITSCKDWDLLESIKIDTYIAGLDEEVSISKLRDYGVRYESGDLKFRIVPKKVFPQYPQMPRSPSGGGGCGCASCGTLQCCPNPGSCIGCGTCGQACCNSL